MYENLDHIQNNKEEIKELLKTIASENQSSLVDDTVDLCIKEYIREKVIDRLSCMKRNEIENIVNSCIEELFDIPDFGLEDMLELEKSEQE